MTEPFPTFSTALTIAGSDSSGGAGIQADLKTFAALGVHGASAITAVTAQTTVGVSAIFPVPADIVTAQLEALAGDITIHATKTGMLVNAAIVEAVAAAIQELNLPLVVVDPIMVATTGEQLLDDDGVRAMCTELLPRALVVTPNIPEAELLTGRSITSLETMQLAAEEIHQLGGTAVVIKGGHAPGIIPDEPDLLIDLLFDGEVFTQLQMTRINIPGARGTGCTFASAIAARLAQGDSLIDAVARAQSFVAGALGHLMPIGHGRPLLDHFWKNRSV